MIHLDFESRSTVDLAKTKCGSNAYARHPSTQVLCAAYAVDDGLVDVWHRGHPLIGMPPTVAPEEFIEAVIDGHEVEAHNANFERAIVRHTWPRGHGKWAEEMARLLEDPARWVCSAAKAASFALPRSLDGAAAALRLDVRKDPNGKALIHLLCKPQKEGGWFEDPRKLQELWHYCGQDVVTERAISNALRPLHPLEQELWQADCRMNERGFTLDTGFAERALALVAEERIKLNGEMFELTDGDVEKGTQRARLMNWAEHEQGVELPNTQADTVTELLEGGTLPKDLAKALEILRVVNMTSVAKFKAALAGVCDDGRVRDTQLFHGANTGRWSGKGMQPHNLPRGVSPDGCTEVAADSGFDLECFEALHGSPTKKLSAAVRGLIVAAPGKHLFVGDYSAIEARVLCWLAGEQEALNLFTSGGDVYVDMASSIYNCPPEEVDSDKRFVGKQAVLGLGYGMGMVKFKANMKTFGVDMPLEFYRMIVGIYRQEKYANVAKFWYKIEQAVEAAVSQKVGWPDAIKVGPLKFFMRGRFLHVMLPSHRLLAYAEPQLALRSLWFFPAVTPEGDEVTIMARTNRGAPPPRAKALEQAKANGWGIDTDDEPSEKHTHEFTYMTARGKGLWFRESSYGGKLTENVTQAVARDIMAAAIVRADADPIFNQVLLTVHDELVCEADPSESLERFEAIVATAPAWAEGLPVDVEAWQGPRYGKA
jgi:DNA polymerase